MNKSLAHLARDLAFAQKRASDLQLELNQWRVKHLPGLYAHYGFPNVYAFINALQAEATAKPQRKPAGSARRKVKGSRTAEQGSRPKYDGG